MRYPTRTFALCAALSFFANADVAFCEEYYSDHGFAIDLPEGFEYLEGDGRSKFSFGSPDGGVRVDIAVYPAGRFSGAKAGAEDALKKLSGRAAFSSFEYSGYGAAFGELSMGSGAAALRGYGLFVDDVETPRDPADRGSGTKAATYDLVVLSYAPASSYDSLSDVTASAIDGFSLNYRNRALPGPLGFASRAALGAPSPRPVTVRFGEASISTEWYPREAAVSQALVEREYRVLTAYARSPELIEAAVARFYRMVFRDAAPSLDRLALQMSAAWEAGHWSGSKPGAEPAAASGTGIPAGPRFGAPADSRAYAEAVLAWVQGFRYERDPAGSDVVNPLSAAFEGRGDCDSRALVMAILLRRENIRSILMVSLRLEHALAAVDAPGAGARFSHAGKPWLVAETTAKVGIGLIDSTQADPALWFGVEFP